MSTNNKFKLAICTLFDPVLNGVDANSSPDILNHYLIMYTIELEDFYGNEHTSIIEFMNMNMNINRMIFHPTIRNYNAIIRNPNYIKLDIIKCEELSGLEQVGYINTFWLKIVQRRWKKIYKMRQDILKARSSPLALIERQQTGQWPKHIRQWPTFTLFH